MIRKVLTHTPLVNEGARETMRAYLCGEAELGVDRAMVTNLERRLFGIRRSRSIVFRGLLDMLTHQALNLPNPAGVPSALALQATYHWARQIQLSSIAIERSETEIQLLLGTDKNHCAWCLETSARPFRFRLGLMDEMIRECHCYPCCGAQFA